MSEHVKYPFEVDGLWPIRHHIPYTVEHEGRTYAINATVFGEPSVHARIQVGREGEPVATYDDLVPGDIVEITDDQWRVAAVDYRTRIVLERMSNGSKEETDA
ncbi:hypothetical protein ABZS86_09315 [Streptomyces sp. NPDC005355]|uniref:hypothetical protein n=1 Tax=Streptomyces sp. NPDC005355 TaxID=3157038 RepID=UPI0033B2ADF5